MLDDSFVMHGLRLRLLQEGRIEDFFLNAGVDLERAADPAGELLLAHLAPRLPEGENQLATCR
jgi:hypothetical protein